MRSSPILPKRVEGNVSHDEVIRRYFATEPPFSTKEERVVSHRMV
jgi:hypothetical protein